MTREWVSSIPDWCWNILLLKIWRVCLQHGTTWRPLWSFIWRYNNKRKSQFSSLHATKRILHINEHCGEWHVVFSALFFSQAVMLDSTDVNMWYKIGQVAVRLMRIPLARHAFEEGLNCNPDHWPCLDNLITILYTLSDYTCKWCIIISSFLS